MRKSKNIEVAPGKVVRYYTAEEATEIARLWLEVFGKQVDGNKANAYMWHTFSFEGYPSIAGKEAIAAYGQQVAPEYVVLSNDRTLAISTDQLPQSCNISDYYVFPTNLAWTMAFTHEDGWLGPYFARHPQYEKLAAENQSKVKKAYEAEIAKRNGWN